MQEVMIDDQLIQAAPDSPEAATCPACGGIVRKRKRRKMDGSITYFYRHNTGEGENCPLRYNPTGER